MNLSFDKLLLKALSEWPDRIIFGDLENYCEATGRYSVKNLENDIADAYIGKDDEIIMRTLHDAISAVLHSVAKYLTAADKSQFRHHSIRERFEKNLLRDMSSLDLNWREQDHILAQSYFDTNQKSDT